MSRSLTSSGVSDGSFCSMSATAPATTGAAALVPDSMKYVRRPHDGRVGSVRAHRDAVLGPGAVDVAAIGTISR